MGQETTKAGAVPRAITAATQAGLSERQKVTALRVAMQSDYPLTAALEREQQAIEQGRERESRLLAMLEVEQATRRELETKLLPAPVPLPKPAPPSHRRVWLLLILLVALLVFVGWWRWDAIHATVATLMN